MQAPHCPLNGKNPRQQPARSHRHSQDAIAKCPTCESASSSSSTSSSARTGRQETMKQRPRTEQYACQRVAHVCSHGAKGHAPWSNGARNAPRKAQRDGRHSRTTCSAIIALGINLRGYETPNCAESQPRAQVQRSTTLMPTPKGTAEQRTTGT